MPLSATLKVHPRRKLNFDTRINKFFEVIKNKKKMPFSFMPLFSGWNLKNMCLENVICDTAKRAMISGKASGAYLV